MKFNKSYVGLREDLLKHVKGTKLHILDVGCSVGVNGDFLINNSIATIVDGVEFDVEMAQLAQNKYNKVFIGDLNDDEFLDELRSVNIDYDFIICGDILEHLSIPKRVLNLLQVKLKPEGKIIVSLPNIAHWELLIQVYKNGKFPRNDRGIFDKTHLSWFTKKDALNIFSNNKFKNTRYFRNYRYRDDGRKPNILMYQFLKLFFKNLVTFQHIIVAQKL